MPTTMMAMVMINGVSSVQERSSQQEIHKILIREQTDISVYIYS
jgi:hypothetical protein